MNRWLYTIAIVLIVLWLVGYLGLNIGGLIHVLLAIAVISILLSIIRGDRS
ncbi:MAG: lmo0937 family membrane protein [Crocinitomicaceae bacterium]|jgi:hypothetical protein|nr:MAG: lmo0937 family membrane protein [Crocinitomicaceae bacterium]